jgi:hypothetical protein
MAQIDEVKAACARLAGMGWQSLLKLHDLDIAKADLAAELARELAIDRNNPGFEDFTLAGKRGVEPGFPAASLLYHAFASPDVHPTATGDPVTSVDAYPTLAELDAVENYIYGLRPFNPASLKDVVSVCVRIQARGEHCAWLSRGFRVLPHRDRTSRHPRRGVGRPEARISRRSSRSIGNCRKAGALCGISRRGTAAVGGGPDHGPA